MMLLREAPLKYDRAMRVLNEIETLPGRTVVTIGNFDGVHLGHQSVLNETIRQAKALGAQSLAVTFDPHPVQVLYPERSLLRIFPTRDMVEQMSRLGLDVVVVQPFNLELAKTPPEIFLSEFIKKKLNPVAIVVGHDFTFGSKRSGHLGMLGSWCDTNNINLVVLPPFELEGARVSSQGLREFIGRGDVELANKWLGRPFYVEGEVEAGAGRGHRINTPTLNLALTHRFAPSSGVYITETEWQNHRALSVSNVGVSPTFGPGLSQKLETHILDYSGNLYDQTVRVYFLRRLRDEKKFDSVDDLKQQIAKDVTAAREFKKVNR